MLKKLLLIFLLFLKLNAGYITSYTLSFSNFNSTSHELVYDPNNLDKKLSELIWKAENVKLLKIGLNYKSNRYSDNFFHFNYYYKLKGNDNSLDDYDWLKSNINEWSEWSHHDDVTLDKLSIIEIIYNYKFAMNSNNLDKYFLLGYRIENKKFIARNGKYIYSSQSGFRDLKGNISGLAITYEETFKTLFFGINLKKQYKKYLFNTSIIYTPFSDITNKDNHHKRFFINNNKFYSTKMLGMKIKIDKKRNKYISFFISYEFIKYYEAKGITTRTYYDGATEATPGTIYSYNGAGIYSSYNILSLGFIRRF